jgi:uncharacterized protein (DUF2236 family)
VNGETALLLGGGRALLMQIAHPMVAAGVADHSAFRRDVFGRLANTLDLTLTVAFGDADQRRRAAARVEETHRRVIGERDGRAYSALDPELLRWVHATLVDSALVTYERFVGQIAPGARARYHEEMKRQAEAFGVPPEAAPRTYDEFRAYVDGMVATLEVTAEARRLSRDVIDLPVPTALAPVASLWRLVTTGLLPPRLREAFGLAWGTKQERQLAAFATVVGRAILPLLPERARRWPHARDASRRTAPRRVPGGTSGKLARSVTAITVLSNACS